MINNIFLTGPPSIGKTTVIKKVIEKLNKPVTGFYTQEIREAERRIGFLLTTLDGKKGYLAHQDIKSIYNIRRYGVSIENIENIAIPSIIPKSKDEIIVIDEIGKMECFSEKFKIFATNALNSSNIVLGTIAIGGTEFIQNIKKRHDIKIYEVTRNNRDELPLIIEEEILKLYISKY